MGKVLKIVLAIFLLICLLDMPYGYYSFVRFIAMVIFGVLAFQSYDRQWNTTAIVYLGLAVLFQPIYKIALGRVGWNMVDIIVAVLLLISLTKPDLLESRESK